MNLKFRLILIFVIGSLVYGQCEEYEQLECISLHDCEWIEDIEMSDCSVFDNSESSCTGYPGECYWDEDITYGSCNGYDNSQWACNNAQGCYWDCYYGYCGCNGQEITGVDTECIGQYEIDNSYCEEIEMPDCSEMNELQCNNDESCDWTDDIENLSCSSLTIEECANYSECNLDADCTQWGSWYTWICYEYGPPYCTGGNIYIDNSYCEEIAYQLGDINGDYSINILDVIETVNLIFDDEYNYIVDMNSDGSINILDIIEMIEIILDA